MHPFLSFPRKREPISCGSIQPHGREMGPRFRGDDEGRPK
jgi:hypothetical protein